MNDQNFVPPLNNLSISDPSQWTVLVVDDEPDNREISQTLLSFSGVKVYTAVNGAEGIKLLEDISPTFILLDLSMPVMDGWDMLKLVRANQKTHSVPIIALTAHAMAGDRERVFEAGFDGYIAKPFRIGDFMPELMSCLHKVLERDKVQAAAK